MAEGLSYGKLVEGVRSVFNTGRTKTMQWRLSQLQATIRCLTEQKDKICKALHMDLRKVCVFLWYSCEIILILCYWKPMSSTVGTLIVLFTWVVATLLKSVLQQVNDLPCKIIPYQIYTQLLKLNSCDN